MIKNLQSLNEYKELLREVKLETPKPFSNIYFLPGDIRRYIELQRATYEKEKHGVVFFFDEETHFRICFYVNEKYPFEISPQNKKCMLRIVFHKGKKTSQILEVNRQLEKLGFKNKGTSVQFQGDSGLLLSNCKSIERYIIALEKKGYHCIIPDVSRYGEIDQLIKDSGIIKDYHLTYRTEEERKALLKGSYLCVVNKDHEICAASIAVVNGSVAQAEAAAVKEEYKMRGLAPVLSYQRYKWLCDNHIKTMQGWILTHNKTSLNYHKSLGYCFTDKYVEEWLLEE